MEEYTIPRIGHIKLNKRTIREIQKLYKDLPENGQPREAAGEATRAQRLHRARRTVSSS